MALFSPVIRSDFNLYERKRPQQRNRSMTSKNTAQVSPKIITGKESSSLDSLLDKRQKMLMLRERRQQRRNVQRCNTFNNRKISVITETDEENENEEDTLEHLRQEFTQMSPIMTIHELEEENDPPTSPSAISETSSSDVGSMKKKKGMVAFFNNWIRSHSFKNRKNKDEPKE